MEHEKRHDIGLSIVVPVFNEEKTIEEVIKQVIQMKKSTSNLEIIIIDDGSTDNTPKVISKFKEEHNIKVISQSKNRGYGSSLKTGVRVSQKDFIAFFDSDGQHRVQDLILLHDSLEDNDLVIGYRLNMHQISIWRSPLKIFLKIFFYFILLKKIQDPTSGLRIWKKSKLKSIMANCSDGFSFSASSLLIASLLGYKIEWQEIKMNKRNSGISQFSFNKIYKIVLALFKIVLIVKPIRILLLFIPLFLIIFLTVIVTNALSFIS
jgi:glycosyltransferase involved in cell wall biosynthesis